MGFGFGFYSSSDPGHFSLISLERMRTPKVLILSARLESMDVQAVFKESDDIFKPPGK